jgi:hypothetical protein
MTGPSFSSRLVEAQFVQAAARSAFELGHHEFRCIFSANDDMNVIAPDVRGEQAPVVAGAAIYDAFKRCLTARLVHFVRRLVHEAQFGR